MTENYYEVVDVPNVRRAKEPGLPSLGVQDQRSKIIKCTSSEAPKTSVSWVGWRSRGKTITMIIGCARVSTIDQNPDLLV